MYDVREMLVQRRFETKAGGRQSTDYEGICRRSYIDATPSGTSCIVGL